ncbi:MAG TPA: tetratricopeptide repeat protein [Thermomicrobiales bacterium]|nr:tetratricopeptide repeat protein [Thermomicrobiales bacterium]
METNTGRAAGSQPHLRLSLLGDFRAAVGERAVDPAAWQLHKARALVTLLALSPGRRLHREQAMDLLWPDFDPDAAANNLRVTLFAARHALAPLPIPLIGEVVLLDPHDELWLDVALFEANVTEALQTRDTARGWEAVGLYRGDLVADELIEGWLAPRRESLRGRFLGLLVELARWEEERNVPEAALAALQRVLAHEPAHERAQRELTRLAAGLRHGGRGDDQRTRATNLPGQLTTFVGREQALTALRAALTAASAGPRLVTLTGTAGCGKTRLALQVANALHTSYADGVWLVELASLAEPALVPQAVASVLGVREGPHRSVLEALRADLAAKHLLLVLDNCEHLAASCAALVPALLGAAPGLRILATSREPLGVPGEVAWPVGPLSLPALSEPATPETVLGSEAGQLFLQRAQDAGETVVVTRELAPVLARLCRELDGLPLALELAAAWVSTLSIAQIVARLDDRFRLLTRGRRTALPRQQTLRAALDWSYTRLGPREQQLLRELAIFAGGFTAEAVDLVCADVGSSPADRRALLATLISKSLAQVVLPGSSARYSLLETIRQFAREHLVMSNGLAPVAERHAEFYLALAESGQAKGRWTLDLPWLEQLDQERDNLRAALAWSWDTAGDRALRLAVALGIHWDVRGQFVEGQENLARAAAHPAGTAYDALRGWAYSRAGNLARRRGNFAEAAQLYREGLRLARQLDDANLLASLLNNLGLVVEWHGDYEYARLMYEESLSRARARGDRARCALLLANLAIVAQAQGETDRAARLHARSHRMFRALGSLGSQHTDAILLTNLGLIAETQGRLDEAAAFYRAGLDLRRHLHDRHGVAISHMALARLALRRGDRPAARALLADALNLRRELGDVLGVAEVLEGVAMLAVECGASELALRLFAATRGARQTLSVPIPPYHQAVYQRYLSLARQDMGTTRSVEVWEEGWRVLPGHAAGEAAGWLDETGNGLEAIDGEGEHERGDDELRRPHVARFADRAG